MTKVLITGIAGFVGFHLAKKLNQYFEVYGIDLVNKHDEGIKSDRLSVLKDSVIYTRIDIRNKEELIDYFDSLKPQLVIHLAAQPGIANSLKVPDLYYETNVNGFFNVLEACRIVQAKVIYASSSSVYSNDKPVFSEQDRVDKQLSFYGTTKRMGEVLASNYARQFNLQCLGLRFFTVYGSWVRKDMAAWKFMIALTKGEKIKLYDNGEIHRDFTHVNDIVHAIYLLGNRLVNDKVSTLHSLFNIGHGAPVKVADYLDEIATKLNRTPLIDAPQLPENELKFTHADTKKLVNEIGYSPSTNLKEGVVEMVDWFAHYYSEVELHREESE